jgi:hypothetical protein
MEMRVHAHPFSSLYNRAILPKPAANGNDQVGLSGLFGLSCLFGLFGSKNKTNQKNQINQSRQSRLSRALPDALTASRCCVIPLHSLNPASEKAQP